MEQEIYLESFDNRAFVDPSRRQSSCSGNVINVCAIFKGFKMIKERPALFSASMMRANLREVDPKSQTRRIVKPIGNLAPITDHRWTTDQILENIKCPYGEPGDELWGRETWAEVGTMDSGLIVYRADYPDCVPAGYENLPPASAITWKPSIHMFRKCSRLQLEIISIRVERLQDISEADAKAEGCEPAPVPECCGMPATTDHGILGSELGCCGNFDTDYTYKAGYELLWESINGAGSWALNPWVWVIEYRRLKP